MKVNFYLKESKADYETSIYCLIRYQNKNVKHYTTQKVLPKFWNPKDQIFRKGLVTSPELNQWLKDIQSFILKLELDWTRKYGITGVVPIIPANHIKEHLTKYFAQTTKQEREDHNKRTFWGYYDNFLERMENGSRPHISKGTPMAKKTIYQFQNLKRHLQNFEKKKRIRIDFDKISLSFYNDFMEYLTVELELAPNTIGKLITNLKVYLKEAYDDGVSTNNIYSHRKFRAIHSVSETVYLNSDEIDALLKIDLSSNIKVERIRDMFVIGCYTGLRFGDQTRIQETNVTDSMIEIAMDKGKEKVIIPIKPQVRLLLSKYQNALHKISNQKYNDYLYEACKKCEILALPTTINKIKGGKKLEIVMPKYEFISSHTARRSFATNEFKAGVLTIGEIMSITGHKTEKSFYKYIREKPRESAERVQAKWEANEIEISRKKLRAV